MTRSRTWIILAILTSLAVVAYLPALSQPFIDDDYPNIQLAQAYGAHGWGEMLADPIFRVRATTHLLFYFLNRTFGMDPRPFYGALILLHVFSTWLVFALGYWSLIGYRVSAWAAAFFAVYEGHQEAVMWVSGSTEPLLVCFGLIAFLTWLYFLEGHGWHWYLLSLLAFCVSLASKESAVIWVALLLLPMLVERKHFYKSFAVIPQAILSILVALSILRTRTYSFRFSDGSFSFHAPFWITWPESFARLFWFWGALALIAILLWKPPQFARVLWMAMLWIGLALIPYSFLTYSHRIPSRQTYLASVGLAIIVGLGISAIKDRRALAIVAAAIVLHNIGYLWTKKRAQFAERAAPIEQLLDFATAHNGAIYMKCFPRPPLGVEAALELMFPGRPKTDLVWNEADAQARHAAVFCYMP